MIEPCAYGVATCFGPNTRNFADIVQLLLAENACTQLQTPEELRPWIESMLQDVESRQQMSARAIAASQKHCGAVQKTWERCKTV